MQRKGWSRKRRVVLLRRLAAQPPAGLQALEPTAGAAAEWVFVEAQETYEYTVLVTNTELEILSLARLYWERADSENTIDELKRQWGWGGFVTQDWLRCQVAARSVALIYNWWNPLGAVRGTGPRACSGDQPAAADVCGGPGSEPRWADDGHPDQCGAVRRSAGNGSGRGY